MCESDRDCDDEDHADGSELDTDTAVEGVPVKTAKAANKAGVGSLEKRLEAVGPFKYPLRIAELY